MSRAQHADARDRPVEQGVVGRALSTIARAFAVLLLSLAFSILFEWIGMTFFWSDEGSLHSREMLASDISFLNDDFRLSVMTSSPARFATRFANLFYHYLFEATGFIDFIHWIQAPPSVDDSSIRITLRTVYATIADYIVAAITITQVFAVRLAVLTLSLPVFVLFGLVGITEGLVQRDLRRWGGGRESSFLYHHAKRWVWPSFLAAWLVYLSIPWSVHPNFVVMPFGALFATSLAVTSATFKKYL